MFEEADKQNEIAALKAQSDAAKKAETEKAAALARKNSLNPYTGNSDRADGSYFPDGRKVSGVNKW